MLKATQQQKASVLQNCLSFTVVAVRAPSKGTVKLHRSKNNVKFVVISFACCAGT